METSTLVLVAADLVPSDTDVEVSFLLHNPGDLSYGAQPYIRCAPHTALSQVLVL